MKSRRTPRDATWSRDIRDRDGYVCQKCRTQHATNSQGLHAHHLFTKSIKATRHDLDNGVSLCLACHMRAHQYQAETREWWRSVIGAERFEALSARAHGRRDRVA